MTTMLGVLLAALLPWVTPLAGPWRAALDLAGGTLRFSIEVDPGAPVQARLCNGTTCEPFSAVRVLGDTVVFELADYAATIRTVRLGDSLVGAYSNVGNRGPRTIPFRAARGRWPVEPAAAGLLGTWDAWFGPEGRRTPRVLEVANSPVGMTGTVLSNSGDYGAFWGEASGGRFTLGHFDGSFVYLITGELAGDTLRGVFHAGLRSQTPFFATRSRGGAHLTPPTEVTRADTSAPFRFAFPGLDGVVVTNEDPRFRGKVVMVDIFGTWCPNCHDAAPTLLELYQTYHARGFEVVSLAYEVTGDPAVDGQLVRRFQQKFGIPWPILLAGVNETDLTAATLPQLQGFTAYPTLLFLDRQGRVRRIHAGFYGPATGAQYTKLRADLHTYIEELLGPN
ncbi:MAG TPA: TlpA disulfide reductase family protein [Gemmatimonadales bacterium]|nr:TlpA disulfide reductase family protein [Gemmatimonadales bacterium]